MNYLDYYKPTENNTIAHIYEHIIGNRLDNNLFKNRFLRLVDYDMWAYTRNTTVCFSFRFHDIKARKCIEESLREIDSIPISLDECMRAVDECSMEYAKDYRYDTVELLGRLGDIASLPWVDKQHMDVITMNTRLTGVEIAQTQPIEYGRRNKKGFTYYIVEYSVSGHFFDNHSELKPLAMMLVQAVSLNYLRTASRTYRCYDAGDEWKYGAIDLEYRNYISFSRKNFPDIGDTYESLTNTLGYLKVESLVYKLIKLLQTGYSATDDYYFGDEEMYKISGMLIGAKGWKRIATEENIMLLLKNLTITILYADEEKQLIHIDELLA